MALEGDHHESAIQPEGWLEPPHLNLDGDPYESQIEREGWNHQVAFGRF
jgi:hypothetical protein